MKAWLLVLPLALSGCGDKVQEQFEDRADLPSCGRVDAGLFRDWRDQNPEAWLCFEQAVATGEDAELRVDFLSDEGGPIPTWYLLHDGRLEIYEDATQDTFGSGDWHVTSCDAPAELDRTIACD